MRNILCATFVCLLLVSGLQAQNVPWFKFPGQPELRLYPYVIEVNTGHTEDITSVAFSPDGTKIVTSSRDKTIRIWDVQAIKEFNPKKELHKLEGFTEVIGRVAFSPDGKKIVSISDFDRRPGFVRIWDVESGEQLQLFEAKPVIHNFVPFSPDGKKVALLGMDGTGIVQIWDVESGEELHALKGHRDGVMFAAFSPDGKKIVTGDKQPRRGVMGNIVYPVRIWDVESGEKLHTLENKSPANSATFHVISAIFAPDGKKIVAVSPHTRRALQIWDVESGEELHVLEADYRFSPTSVIFSPDERKITSVCSNGIIHIWDIESGKELQKLRWSGTTNYRSIAFTPDGKTIVATFSTGNFGAYGAVGIWDVDSGKLLRALAPDIAHAHVRATIVSPDGKHLVSYNGKTIWLWDLEQYTTSPHPVTRPAIRDF